MKNNVKMIATSEVINDQRVLKEAKYIMGKGYNVEILCWDRSGKRRTQEIEIYNGIKIKRFFPKAEYGTGVKQLVPFLKYINEVKTYLRDKEFKVLHCQNLDSTLVSLMVPSKSVRVFDMREFYEGRVNGAFKKKIFRYFVELAVKKSDFVIHVNETQMNHINKKYHHKMLHLPNYPSELLGENNTKSVSGKLRIAYIGAVRQYKEFSNLFEALAGMPNVEVLVYGVGVSYNKVRDLAIGYDNVKVFGEYDPRDSAELYRNADIIYCVYDMGNLNWRTAYPIKFYESLMTNTPLIVSRGSVLEQFNDEYNVGYVVDGNSVVDIRDTVEKILGDPDGILARKKNIEKIAPNYKWEAVVKKLDVIY